MYFAKASRPLFTDLLYKFLCLFHQSFQVALVIGIFIKRNFVLGLPRTRQVKVDRLYFLYFQKYGIWYFEKNMNGVTNEIIARPPPSDPGGRLPY